jgi:hypothetical protein
VHNLPLVAVSDGREQLSHDVCGLVL